ncbi:MAG: hypothetical protein IJK18_06655 [Clostridia bacterium]|nr:hypothetical protein [Clostridia bacterium]
MPNKYQKAISNIKASDELKEKIKINIEQELAKNANRGGPIMKIKRILITIFATLATLVCGGAVYAALGGTINGVPISEWFGIKFSQNYTEYEEPVQNQVIENDYAKVELQSTICDDGFTILKFYLNIKDLQKIRKKIFFGDFTEEEMNKETQQYGLHFNDILQNENDEIKDFTATTNNNNLIIDGKNYYVSGSVQSAEENIQNKDYTIYQMWFLTDEELKSKETFTITLNNIALEVNGVYFKFKDSINIELSKSKAKQNTKEIKTNNDSITYRNMKKSLSEVKITPLQNIIKLSTIMTSGDYDGVKYVSSNGEQLPDLKYVVTDQNGKELRSYNIETDRKITYSDGRTEKIDLSNLLTYGEILKNVSINSTEYITIESGEDIKALNINVQEIDISNETIRNIGKYTIDLENKKTNSENKNELVNIEKGTISKNTNITTSIPTFDSSNIEWEEYPSNFDKYFSKIIEDTDMDWPNKKAIKTLYSIVKNKLYKNLKELYSIGLIETGGDMYDYQSVETNYNQYNYSSEDKTIEKYTDTIEFKLAKIGPTYLESAEENYIKILTQKSKEQYELLKSQNYNKDNGYYFGLDRIIIMNGNNSSKEIYKNNARAKKIKLTINDDKEYIIYLKDTNKAQFLNLNYKQKSIAKPINAKVEVLEAYKGEKTQDIYISDMQFVVTTNISMGI